MRMDGWPALSIHGDKSQQERDWVLGVSQPFLAAIDSMLHHVGCSQLTLICLDAG